MLRALIFTFLVRTMYGQIVNLPSSHLPPIEQLKHSILERDDYLFGELVQQMLTRTKISINCFAIITDNYHLKYIKEEIFRFMKATQIIIVVKDSEDLMSPNFITLESLKMIRKEGCELYIITLSNGVQASNLLKFGDRYRMLDTRAQYIMFHDRRLFQTKFNYLWRRYINVIFIRSYTENLTENSTIELSTIQYPARNKDFIIPKRMEVWRFGKYLRTNEVFPNKAISLNNYTLRVVMLDHIPAVKRLYNNTKQFTGIEVEIVQTLAKAMNFAEKFFYPMDVKNQWGQRQLNGTFTGLLGEMVEGRADIALGNLHYTPYHLELNDLTIPYITQCLTFLTPESLYDNSWKTLILPFKLYMWVAVIIVLLFTGLIFNCLAKIHKNIENHNLKKPRLKTDKLKKNIKDVEVNKEYKGLYIFSDLTNCILYTFGMLLVVSLPKLPSGSSLQILTGWYWLYCVLVVVSYRASMTAIFANPTPRVTIDTMTQLADSSIECGGWGDQSKHFFTTSLDEIGQKIGSKFVTIDDAQQGVQKVTRGELAYYGNVYFLKSISTNRKEILESLTKSNESNDQTIGDRNLHIMKECAVNMPISIGLQKNSPIKPRMDKLVRRIIEAGLIKKWLNDVMEPINAATTTNDEDKKTKRIGLPKLYGAFVVLGIGYLISFIALLFEIYYWNYVTKKDPKFDKYEKYAYYNNKK